MRATICLAGDCNFDKDNWVVNMKGDTYDVEEFF